MPRTNMMTLPIWAFALGFAVVAPFAAKAFAQTLDRHMRAKSRRIVESAKSAKNGG